MKNILVKAPLLGFLWFLGYFFIRKLFNPASSVLTKDLKYKDKKYRKELIKNFYDALFGGFAAMFTAIILSIIGNV